MTLQEAIQVLQTHQDWRGKHELATIYSDSYYLDNSSDWEAIYDLKLL